MVFRHTKGGGGAEQVWHLSQNKMGFFKASLIQFPNWLFMFAVYTDSTLAFKYKITRLHWSISHTDTEGLQDHSQFTILAGIISHFGDRGYPPPKMTGEGDVTSPVSAVHSFTGCNILVWWCDVRPRCGQTDTGADWCTEHCCFSLWAWAGGIEARIILEAAHAQLSSTRRTAAVAECCITAMIRAFLLGITLTIRYNTF